MSYLFIQYRYIDEGFGVRPKDDIIEGYDSLSSSWWSIPRGNPNWAAYQDWLAQGNTPVPANQEWFPPTEDPVSEP